VAGKAKTAFLLQTSFRPTRVRSKGCQMGDVMRTGCSILRYYPLEPIAVFAQGSGGQGTTLKERVGQRGGFGLSLTAILSLRRVAYDGRRPSVHSIALVSSTKR
jgi:hypothetical protein